MAAAICLRIGKTLRRAMILVLVLVLVLGLGLGLVWLREARVRLEAKILILLRWFG